MPQESAHYCINCKFYKEIEKKATVFYGGSICTCDKVPAILKIRVMPMYTCQYWEDKNNHVLPIAEFDAEAFKTIGDDFSMIQNSYSELFQKNLIRMKEGLFKQVLSKVLDCEITSTDDLKQYVKDIHLLQIQTHEIGANIEWLLYKGKSVGKFELKFPNYAKNMGWSDDNMGVSGKITYQFIFCNDEQIDKIYAQNISKKKAAPEWYTETEMYNWLINNNYTKEIATELSAKWARDLQGAFKKGWEIGANKNRFDNERERDYEYFDRLKGVEEFIDQIVGRSGLIDNRRQTFQDTLMGMNEFVIIKLT